MPLIPALGRQRQLDLCEFKTSLVYRVSFRTAKATQRNPVSKKTNRKACFDDHSGVLLRLCFKLIRFSKFQVLVYKQLLLRCSPIQKFLFNFGAGEMVSCSSMRTEFGSLAPILKPGMSVTMPGSRLLGAGRPASLTVHFGFS